MYTDIHDGPRILTVSPKRKYTLLSSQVLKTEGAQMKSRGCAKPTIKLARIGPSLILKIKEMAADQQKPWRLFVFVSPSFRISKRGLAMDCGQILIHQCFFFLQLYYHGFLSGWMLWRSLGVFLSEFSLFSPCQLRCHQLQGQHCLG